MLIKQVYAIPLPQQKVIDKKPVLQINNEKI